MRGPVLQGRMSLHEALVMDRIQAIREREGGMDAGTQGAFAIEGACLCEQARGL